MIMSYITHIGYNGKSMTGVPITISSGEKLDRKDGVLFYKSIPICIYRSLIGKQHFAVNNDGRGMERGILTHMITYSPRSYVENKNGQSVQQRFTNEELNILSTKWNQYIKPNCDMLLFNDAFFEAPIETLREIAKDVHIDILPYEEAKECTV